jgi:putative ABC transport system permease protein
MLRNYLITAIRNIFRDKFYTFINIFGLAAGLAVAIFILLYVKDELTYDKYNTNYKRIYRLESDFTIAGKEDKFAATQVPLAPTLKDEYPEIEEYVRFVPAGTLYFKYESKEFREDSLFFCDSTIFRVFTYPLITGDPSKALNRPYTMVITKALANRYFGKANAVGKTVLSMDGHLYEVTGVLQDIPGNSHIKFNGLISDATIREQIGKERFDDRSAGSFWNINIFSYIMLKENTTIDGITQKFPDFYKKYMKSIGDQINGSFKLKMKPLARVHHYSADLGYDFPGGNIKYVYIFSIAGLLILIIAAINYMNLATARSARRAREAGIRKIVGSTRGKLIGQYLSESLFITLLALLLSVLLVYLFLPEFNHIANKGIIFRNLTTPSMIGRIIGLLAIIGLIAGSYPAFYLSSYNPAMVIKGQTDKKGGNVSLRKILVVLQFAISVFMLVGMMVVSSQLNYMQKTNIGFKKDNMMVMTLRDTTFKKNTDAFREELLKIPDITGVSFSTGNPGSNVSIQVMRIEGDSGKMIDKAINNYFIDYDYLPMMGMKILQGRNYDRGMTSDSKNAFIINETAARKFGWIDSASKAAGNYLSVIGKKFYYGIDLKGGASRPGQVVGIVKDFHYNSLHNPIEPIVLLLMDNVQLRYGVNISLSGQNRERTIAAIDKIRQDFNDKYPFEYKFIDESLHEYYIDEERINILFRIFTILTIFIAMLGLLGLSSFLTQQRTREIGVRKVMGATSSIIIAMFIQQFSIWVIVANIVALPLSYYFMGKWLEDFSYRTHLQIWIFVAAFLLSLIVAILTVSYRVIIAANTNPSDAVRYE